ncbi:FadR/GntR family transcriptional regulator [Microbaculum marinum]|uniref:FCD domain-containing protein n=1 Tax=Microbaculum marinum TaxID=1764581 RepID=A0AAW9RM61_9HYPH
MRRALPMMLQTDRHPAKRIFDKLDILPAYRVVSNAIEQRIMDGQLQFGDKLPTETQMAEDFGVNRSTVREGIRLLEQRGLVKRKAGRRLFVALPRYDELGSREQRALILRRVSFRELWEISMTLEPAIARMAAERIGEEDLAGVDRNVRQTRQAIDSGRSLVDEDIEFHILVARATGNEAMLLTQEPTILLCRSAMSAIVDALPQAPGRLLEAHAGVFDALCARDGDAAERWMRKHFTDFKRGFDLAGLDDEQPIDAVVASVKPGGR